MTSVPTPESSPDPLLRVLRPPRDDRYLAVGDDPKADQLVRRVMALDARRRTRTRTRLVVGCAAGLTVIGAGAAAAVIVTRTADDQTALACYSSAEVRSAAQFAIEPDPSRSPIEQCAALWSDGRISSDGAPLLTACVTDAGIVAVLPGGDRACSAAGWALAAQPTDPPTDRTAELTSSLSDRFAGQCLGADAAVVTVEQVLAGLGLTDWSIQRPAPDDDACFAPVVDAAGRSVGLVGLPG